MKTGSLTKLVFGGVAAGIALSSAIVVATSISHMPADNAATPVAVIDAKADRTALPPVSERVARAGKADALDITISILRGSDTAFGDRIMPPPDRGIAAQEPAAVPHPQDTATVAVEPETPPATDSAVSEAQPDTQPSSRARSVAITRSGPTNIIPAPSPTGNLPATAPAGTSTNISIDPLGSDNSLRDRQDLAR